MSDFDPTQLSYFTGNTAYYLSAIATYSQTAPSTLPMLRLLIG